MNKNLAAKRAGTGLRNQAMSKREVVNIVLNEIARGSNSAPLLDGRCQMRVDRAWLLDRTARSDAVGKMSKRDIQTMNEALIEIERIGILRGELNGYPLIVSGGEYEAARKLGR